LNQVDFDLGSVGPTLLEGDRVFQVGKDGIGYVLDALTLVASAAICSASRSTRLLRDRCHRLRSPLVYVPCDHSLTAVRVTGSRFDVAWRSPDFRSGSPIVAAGLVWDFDFEGGYLWA